MSDEPVLLGRDEGEGSGPFLIKAAGEDFVLTEFRYPPGREGPAPHIHRHHSDAFYVLEGRLRITLGDEQAILDPGGWVFIPPEVIHTFDNPGPDLGRYLNFHAPGMGFERYLRGEFDDFDQVLNPPPGSGRPASEAILLAAGEGVKVDAAASAGALGVMETTVDLREEMVDSFYVLDGTLTLQLDGRAVEAPAGSYARVPPGNAHTFSNLGEEPVRVLNFRAF